MVSIARNPRFYLLTGIPFLFLSMLVVPAYGQLITIPVGNPPVLDGEIQSLEWADAVTTDISSTGVVPAGTVTLYLKYSDDGRYMWWAIDDTNDLSLDNEDQTGIWFDDDNSNNWDQDIGSDEGANYVMWNSTDSIIQTSFSKLSDIDSIISRWPTQDTTNIIGDISTVSGHVQYEAQVDLFWPPDGDPNSELQYPFGTDLLNCLLFCSDGTSGSTSRITGLWPSTATTDPATFGDLQFLPLPNPSPQAPTDLVGTISPPNTLNLFWTPPAANIDGSIPTGSMTYNVYRKEKNGNYTLLQSGIVSPSFSDSTRVPGKFYLYVVTAKNLANKEGPPSNVLEDPVKLVTGNQPTINGTMAPMEWDDAIMLDITNTSEGFAPGSTMLYMKTSSDGRFLWFAIKDSNNTVMEDNDGFDFWHDDDHNHYWVLSTSPTQPHEGLLNSRYNSATSKMDTLFQVFISDLPNARISPQPSIPSEDMEIAAMYSSSNTVYESQVDLFWQPAYDNNPGYQYPFITQVSGLRIVVIDNSGGSPVVTGLFPPGSTMDPLSFSDLQYPTVTNPPPMAPSNVYHSTMPPNAFNLFWTPPTQRIDGSPILGTITYNVYKRTELGDYILWKSNLSITSISDRSSIQGVYYHYIVTATEDSLTESPPSAAEADYAGGVGIMDSSPATAGIIDGVFNNFEWTKATKLFIPDGVSVGFPYYLYQQHDDQFIYICMDVVGVKTIVGGHYGGVFFDTGNDQVLSDNSEDAVSVFKNLTVQHQVYNASIPGYVVYSTGMSGAPFTATDRDQAGMIAAFGFGPSPNDPEDHVIYEFKIPMNLGDLDTSPGSFYRAYYYILANGQESYWPRNTDYTNPNIYGIVNLVGTAFPVPVDSSWIIIIILLLLGPAFILQLIRNINKI